MTDDLDPRCGWVRADQLRDAIAERDSWKARAEAAEARQGEPVAWQERQEIAPGVFSDWYERASGWALSRPTEIESGGIRYQFRALYDGAPARPEPLTDNDLRRIAKKVGLLSSHDGVTVRSVGHQGMTAEDGFAFARAIERAHNITPKDQDA